MGLSTALSSIQHGTKHGPTWDQASADMGPCAAGLPNFAEPNTREITQTLTQQFNVFLSDIRYVPRLSALRPMFGRA
eukprot:2963451-Rhodomonas_salina.1